MADHDVIMVELGDHRYPIVIGSGVLCDASLWQRCCQGANVFIVTDETVAPLFFDTLVNHINLPVIGSSVLPVGEAHKTVDTWYQVHADLIAAGATRQTVLITLGGGVVGDIGGFVAATYQRGIPFIQVPTTLLAQVDASVGGKTAINHTAGKNMIGAFYQPQAVVIDTNVLASLPDREYRSGMAEVLKYGFIQDGDFFEWLLAHAKSLQQRDPDKLAFVIERSCAIKAHIVAQDEREQGVRAYLNFGHTFAHAIEACTHYKHYTHGEAVAIGMLQALKLSEYLGHIDGQYFEQTQIWLTTMGLPTQVKLEGFMPNELIAAMRQDKKRQDQLRFVVLERLGCPVLAVVEDKQLIEKVLIETSAE